MFRFSLFLILSISVAACAPRAALHVLATDVPGAAIQTVFVGTSRTYEDGRFTARRLESVDFTRFEVSVPPDREMGEIAEHWGEPDPTRDFMVRSADRYSDAGAFRGGLAQALAALSPNEREVAVYIHGFNNTFADGLYRSAQIGHDFSLPGLTAHFSWPSAARPVGYAYDRDSALFARDALEQFLRQIALAGANRIILVAHSLGTALTMETLRQLRIGGDTLVIPRLRGVILMSPDIDIEVFRAQAHRIEPLPQPFVIFSSRRDRLLLISAGITGQRDRLGSLDSIDEIADLDITVIDVSNIEDSLNDPFNHATAISSPTMIGLLRQLRGVNTSLDEATIANIGLLPGTVLTVRSATEIILSPILQ